MRLALACFGKLRLYEDFLEVRRFGVHSAAVRDWLIEGVSAAQRDGSSASGTAVAGSPTAAAEEAAEADCVAYRTLWPQA